MMLERGLSVLAVRRIASSGAMVLTAVTLLLFAVARTALQATGAYCLLKLAETLHSSGISSNRLEVGGPDMGMISSVVNIAATMPAYVVPFVGVYIRKRTGGKMPALACTHTHYLSGRHQQTPMMQDLKRSISVFVSSLRLCPRLRDVYRFVVRDFRAGGGSAAGRWDSLVELRVDHTGS